MRSQHVGPQAFKSPARVSNALNETNSIVTLGHFGAKEEHTAVFLGYASQHIHAGGNGRTWSDSQAASSAKRKELVSNSFMKKA